MKKITLLICLVIIFNSPISAYAQATSTTPTVTIAAGSGAAVGGIYNQNGSKTAMTATALTLAVLSATGAAVKLTEQSIAAGKTVYQVINDKFAQWVGGTSAEELTPTEAEELQSRFKVITGGGGDPEDPNNNDENGTNVSEDGKLWFSPGSLAMLKQFCDFLESSNAINTYEEAQPGSLTTLEYGQTCYTDTLTVVTDHGTTTYTMTQKCACFVDNYPGSFITFVCNKSFKLYKNGKSAGGLYSVHQDGLYGKSTPQAGYTAGYYIVNSTNPYAATTPGNINDTEALLSTISRNGWNPVEASDGGIESDGIYKGENYNPSILENPNNQSLVVDPGILPNISPNTDQQLSIPDYLQLLIDQAQANATAQNQPISVPAIDPATLEVTPLEVPVIEQDPISDPVPSEEADPIETPDNPVQDPEKVPTPEDAVELMKVDLTRIFPFCIPWDLYRLIEKFNADPVTPSLTIDWGDILGSIGVDFETTIDLHDYDGVASILRTMETVAFVIGLAVATRSIFLQS